MRSFLLTLVGVLRTFFLLEDVGCNEAEDVGEFDMVQNDEIRRKQPFW